MVTLEGYWIESITVDTDTVNYNQGVVDELTGL